jgi:hypothetical protein
MPGRPPSPAQRDCGDVHGHGRLRVRLGDDLDHARRQIALGERALAQLLPGRQQPAQPCLLLILYQSR